MQNQTNASPEEVAWAAGLFEGEGTLGIYPRKYGAKVGIVAKLGMTDRDAVERFARIVGCGAVHPRSSPKHEAKGYKPLYEWYVQEAELVRAVIALLMPYLCGRRKVAAEKVLEQGAGIKSHNAKKTHCPKNHELVGDNLILEPIKRRGDKIYFARRCRQCRTVDNRERARRAKGIAPDRYRKE